MEKELSGTTGTQTQKYLGTESSPWPGLLGLHLTVTTVARPSSHEVVAVEDLIWNRKKCAVSNVSTTVNTCSCFIDLHHSSTCNTNVKLFAVVLLPLSAGRNEEQKLVRLHHIIQTSKYSENSSVFLASLISVEQRNKPAHKIRKKKIKKQNYRHCCACCVTLTESWL